MKRGEHIADYELLDDLRMAGGGNGLWAFARRDGEEFFLKQFVSPVWPPDGASLPPTQIEKRRAKCQDFEAFQIQLLRKLQDVAKPGGNIVYPVDFFRHGTRYYKVTEKVDVASLSLSQIASQPLQDKFLIIMTVVQSVQVLHRLGIVHSDIKRDNILIKRAGGGRGYVAKLIDLDASFFSSHPPRAANTLGGDQIYMAPECYEFIIKETASAADKLCEKLDIFALGLVAHEYLCGTLPTFFKARYAGEALLNEIRLTISGAMSGEARNLIEAMLAKEPGHRPSAQDVVDTFRSLYLREKSGKGPAIAAKPERPVSGGIRTTVRTAGPAPRPSVPPDHGASKPEREATPKAVTPAPKPAVSGIRSTVRLRPDGT